MQVLRILWGSLVSATVILFTIVDRVRPRAQVPNPVLVPALGAAALGVLAVSIVLPRQQLRLAVERRSAPIVASAAILGLALTESVAMFGFVLAFLGHPIVAYAPFFGVSWLCFLLRFPRATHPLGALGPALGSR